MRYLAEMGDEFTFVSPRKFSVWVYTVSHSQLLLRSTKQYANAATRVDVLFKGVDAMDVPTLMHGLTVNLVGANSFALSGDGWAGSVKALGCWAAEDEGEYFDESPFSHSLPGPDVLAQLGDQSAEPVRMDDPPMEQPT